MRVMLIRFPIFIFTLFFSLPCIAYSNWYEATKLDLYAKSATGDEAPAHWRFTVPNQHNLSLEMDLRAPKSVKGRMMLVLGRVILSQGIQFSGHQQAQDELEGPILMYQLTIEVLQRSFPLGPQGIRQREIIRQENIKRAIKVKTANGFGEFGPPINIQGMLSKKKNNSVDFELFFSFYRQNRQEKLRLYGNWNKPVPAPKFSQTMKLHTWSLYNIGKTKFKKPNTLGELHSLILHAEANP